MEYLAHIRKEKGGKEKKQTVREHLLESAKRAQFCLKEVGLSKMAYLSGILHDFGKYTKDFQNYLKEGDDSKRGSVIHTFQGCQYILEKYHDSEECSKIIASELVAYAVAAHHGLFDCVDAYGKIGLQYRQYKDHINYEEACSAFEQNGFLKEEIESLFEEAEKELTDVLDIIECVEDDREYCFELGLLARLLLSSVIEGDRFDTARFMNGENPPIWPEDMRKVWQERILYMEERLSGFQNITAVDKARSEISNRCKDFAAQPPNIYRLNVPTGGGKTLSSLRYALAHAEKYNKKRIIFTSPLLSILEQNSKVIHDYVGDEKLILEHHSNVVQSEEMGDLLDERELMTQSWNAPVIITTMVQLLNTFFDGKTTSIRRFQALCESVIIIDEVQTVPTRLLTMFNLSIQFLKEICHATIVFCSATQPRLELADHPLKEQPIDIIPYDSGLWSPFKRTDILLYINKQLDEIPEIIRTVMEESESLLVICNKKDEASYLLDKIMDNSFKCFHLSAAMCMQHRRDTIEKLKQSLEMGKKTVCISTQVIEAGVDISFQKVIRLAAGMDSIVQAAGRCNRNGESEEICPVYVVNCTDEKLGKLPDIKAGRDATIELMEAYKADRESFGNDLASEGAIRQYYSCLYAGMPEETQDYPIVNPQTTLFDLLSDNRLYTSARCPNIENYSLRQAFKTAGREFTVFDEDSMDVLVPYGGGESLILNLNSEQAESDPIYQKKLLSEASNYSVSLYQYQRKQLEEKGAIYSVCGNTVLVLQPDYYDSIRGLLKEPKTLVYWEV